MVSDSSKKKGPQKKAAPAAKNGGNMVAAASSSQATAKEAVAAAASSKVTAKKAAQKKGDDVVKKAAAKASKKVGKAVAAAATVFDVANGVYTPQMSDQTCTGVHCSHPLSRDIQPAKEHMREKEENTGRPGLVQCKCCLSWGDCTVGKACKYKHGRGKIPVAPITEYNFLGLPIRPGEKDCPCYMSNGSCEDESNCRFNHPDPTAVEGGDAPSLCGDGGSGPPQGAFQPTEFSWSPPRTDGGSGPPQGAFQPTEFSWSPPRTDGGSGPPQGAFQPTEFSWSPPRTANETVRFVPVVLSPTHKVPPPNVEWNRDQNTTVMETPQPHSSLSGVAAAPSPTTTPSPPPVSPTSTDSRLPASPRTTYCTPISPKLVEEDDPKFAGARYGKLHPKMVKLCARSCELKAAYEFVESTIDYMCAEVEKMFLEKGDSIDGEIEQLDVVDPKQVNGLKKGVNLRKHTRRSRKRKNVISKSTHPGQATVAESLLQFI